LTLAKNLDDDGGSWKRKQNGKTKHTTGGIPRWSPTLVLVARFSAYVWQSGRDAQFSLTYGRMCLVSQMRSLSILISKASEAFDKHSLLRGSDE
jgi:hypothetical protein